MGHYNESLGTGALEHNNNERNSAFGAYCMYNNFNGKSNCAFGTDAMKESGDSSFNVAVGMGALWNVKGDYNTAIGYLASSEEAGKERNYTTSIGANTQAYFNNSTAIGANAVAMGENQLQLGDTEAKVYTRNGYYWTSDVRDKADIRDTQLGLDFIMQLRPVDFRWDMRADYKEAIPDSEGSGRRTYKQLPKDGSKKRSRFHHGFIAQEVGALEAEFGGYQDFMVKGTAEMQTLNYLELIAPMVKAIQEQQQMIEAMQAQVRELQDDS